MSKRGQPRSTASRAPSLLGAVLGGLLGGPVCRDELREAAQRPAALELVDDIDEVALGIDAESEAVVHQGERDGQPLAAAYGAGEEKATARDGEQADPALDTPVVDLKAPVVEAAAEEGALVDRVGR